MSILDTLNTEQRKAASVIDGALLILAGAGSGKTRTITTRLAYLVQEIGIPPSQTLTLTFTNRAASEMRYRALGLIPHAVETPLLCTFHRFGLLFLRFYMRLLGRLNNFIVIDTSDRKKILRDLISTLNITATDEQIANEIGRFKNASLLPQNLHEQNIEKGSHIATMLRVYEMYQNYLQANNLVDFDDLLLLPYQILSQNPDVANEVSLRYRYIMVDEYQDTNELQNKLLDCLLVAHQNICVVGDDDQAIYGWRGANVDYILHFQERFSGAQIVRLEENYRSTLQILDVANKLIAHNENRLGKVLVSRMGSGEEVCVLENIADYSEIDVTASKISKLIAAGTKPHEIAILFRLNAFSRSIEEGLTRARIPFKLIGTIGFYERREIKDYLAYFRFLINFKDSFSLSAIIDRPRRGVGRVSLRKAFARMQEMGIQTFYEFSRYDEELASTLGQKRAGIVKDFFATLETLHTLLSQSLSEFLDQFESYIPLRAYYAQLEDGVERTANIDELFGVMRSKIAENPEIRLEEILNEFSISSNVDDIEEECVLCMSIHNSKGLEFEHVFVVGLEEGFFPLSHGNLEEERRLGYVACTRAKKTLTLSYATMRYFHGKESHLRPSRFLAEAGLIDEIAIPLENDSFQIGDLVRHSVFGAGKVESLVGKGDSLKLQINFGGLSRELLATAVTKIF